MRFDEHFIQRVIEANNIVDIIAQYTELKGRGDQHMGLCPFPDHNEKTGSFSVSEGKQLYNCFGSKKAGNIITFLKTYNDFSFVEAIEYLANRARIELPKEPEKTSGVPRRRVSQDTKNQMFRANKVAAVFYHQKLKNLPKSHKLNSYLEKRNLTPEIVEDFRIGYAPEPWDDLTKYLSSKGVPTEISQKLGLIRQNKKGGHFDLFRDRLMFPIFAIDSEVIVFGARINDQGQPKYINSVESDVFKKGQSFYGLDKSAKFIRTEDRVFVVEGYMDVIALAQSGIDYAVAPLGTALTEEQIAHLWQMADEPILSFDGDNAGLRAAGRALERALPMLKPGKSLRFMMMPEGDDPDTLVQREGTQAIEALIDKAEPLVNMLWSNLTAGVPNDTPERRAGLEKKIFMQLADIEDENVKKLYQREYRDRLFKMFRGPQSGGGARRTPYSQQGRAGYGGRKQGPVSTGLLSKTQLGRSKGSGAVVDKIERIMILTLVNHPEILVRHEEEVAGLKIHTETLDNVRKALLDIVAADLPLESSEVAAYLSEHGLWSAVESLLKDDALKGDWFAMREAALSDALTGFEHTLGRYHHITEALTAYRQAEADYAADMTEENHARFVAAQEAYRAMEEKVADKEGYRLESGRFSFN